MDFVAVLDQVITLLRQRGRLTYRTLKRQFELDDAALEDLKEELIYGQRLAADEDERVLVWMGDTATPTPPASRRATAVDTSQGRAPSPTHRHIWRRKSSPHAVPWKRAQAGHRAVCRPQRLHGAAGGSRPGRGPAAPRSVLERMMAAVHRYEGTVNQVMGDGIMALFGAPLAHEDHAVRVPPPWACKAAVQQYAAEVQRTHGVPLQMRVGLNAGEVVVRAIGNDLHMDYSAIGQTTHLAARMEQMAMPGSILITPAVLGLAEGYVQVRSLGPVPVRGLDVPMEVFELVGASGIRRRLQAAAVRGSRALSAGTRELAALGQALERAGAGQGQVVAVVGEAGVGKSRLVYECVHSPRTQGWLVLESASVSLRQGDPYFPVIDLLKRYVHIEDADEPRTIRARVTGQVLTLDETCRRRSRPSSGCSMPCRTTARFAPSIHRNGASVCSTPSGAYCCESQVQPLLLVFEDLHWIDTETQALLDRLVDSLPTARILLLVNYRPEYQHGWSNKTSYTQLRLDPLPPASADEVLQALLGDDLSLTPLKPLLIVRTEGNPFFLEESVRALMETGVLVGERGAIVSRKPLQSLQVPATVQAILAARIDRLPPEEKRLLRLLPSLAWKCPCPCQAIAEAPEESLQRSLAQLQAAEFLYETRLFPRARVHFQARPHARGGLWEPPAGAAASAACAHRAGP